MPKNYIEIRNARIHNPQNVNVSIPKNKLTVITGVSGSDGGYVIAAGTTAELKRNPDSIIGKYLY